MEVIIKVCLIIVGLFIGKLLNVCIYTIPNNNFKIMNLINIIMRKDKYYKRKKISRDRVIEIITIIMFLLIYNYFGINIYSIYILVVILILLLISFIDIDHYIIPDSLIILGMIFIISFNILNLKDVFLGGLLCGGSVLIFVLVLERLIKKEVMGGGDIKLFFMIGMFLGIKGGLITIILSIYLGAIYGIYIIIYRMVKKIEYNSIIPYGPFISLAAVIYIIYGQMIIDLYKRIII